MSWYKFNQNNSGGSWDVDDMVCHRVFIEAGSAEEANRIAMDMGIYFDGCSTGMDCSCCGDRWYPQSGDGDTYPYKYTQKQIFKTVEEHAQFLADEYGLTKPDARIYYADGKRVTEIFKKDKRAA